MTERSTPLKLILPIIMAISIFALATLVGCGSNEKADSERSNLQRSKVLISSIKSYTKAKGFAPEKLESLVPTQIKQIPDTGFGDSASYRYSRVKDNLSDWSLEIIVPRVPTRTVYLYRASGDYASCVAGASLHQGYKIIDSTASDGWLIVREQTD